MKSKFADVAYKCGAYHQLGKALVPPEYQIWQDDFTAEEQEVTYVYDIEKTPSYIIPPQTGITSNVFGLMTAKLMMVVLMLFAIKRSKEA